MQTDPNTFYRVEHALGHGMQLPQWTQDHLSRTLDVLRERGFPDAQLSELGDTIDFSSVDFPNGTSFDGFVFSKFTSFEGARFGGRCHSFTTTIFAERVSFRDVEFCGEFVGINATFGESSSFEGAKFRSQASFTNSRFQERAQFDGAELLGNVKFNGCQFNLAAEFTGAVFERVADFVGAKFKTNAIFRRARFLTSVPTFFESTLPEYTVWTNAEWPKRPRENDDAEDHAQRYQRLARMMNRHEKFDDQRMFVRQEMRARRWIDGRLPVGYMNWAYAAICDYGFGIRRVAFWWLMHIVLGAVALTTAKLPALMEKETLWRATGTVFSDFHLAIAISFGNAHGPLGLNATFFKKTVDEWPCYGVVGPVQTVLGVIILFFLLLTIRNRFRMR